MQVRRTGAKKGQSPIWYVQASTEAEVEAMKAGLLEDWSPDWRYPYVLAWGMESKSDAEAMIEALEPEVLDAVDLLENGTGLDDFTVIDGVGPVGAQDLHDAGLYTYDDLRSSLDIVYEVLPRPYATKVEAWLSQRLC